MPTIRRSTGKSAVQIAAACTFAMAVVAPAMAADQAKGTIALGKAGASIGHVVLVRGPDEMDPARTVLRLYFSTDDISAKVKACKALSCADQAVGDGASVDYGDASHLGYWVRLRGGLVQNSGGTDASAFVLLTHAPDHLAGKLHVDATPMGGPTIDAEFDATLAATFTSVR